MTTNEAKAITDKLSDLIKAADDFGKSSEQLAKARGDFDEYLQAVKHTDAEMLAVIAKCDKYIDAAKSVVDADLTEQVRTIVNETENAVKESKEHCEQVTAEYDDLLKKFAEQKGVFEKHQDDMVEAVKEGFVKSDEMLNNAAEALEKKLADFDSEYTEHVGNITSAISDESKKLQEEVKASSSKTAKEIDELNGLDKAEFANLRLQLNAVKEQQSKDHLFIMIASVASVVAAVATIIGLFI